MKGKVWIAWLCAIAALVQVGAGCLSGGVLPASAAELTANDKVETFYYDLSDGSYLVTGGGQDMTVAGTSLTVNGVPFTSGSALSEPGDYTIFNRYQNRNGEWVELTQQVVLYNRGDAHPDGQFDIRDLVAMKKHQQGLTLATKAGQMAMDAYLDKTDASVMRGFLLSDKGTAALDKAFPDTNTALSFNPGSNDVMPIGGYEGPADKANADKNGYDAAIRDYMTDEIYGWVKDSGINLILSAGHSTSTPELTTQKQLALAQKYGLRVFVGPSYLFSSPSEGGGVTEANLTQLLREYSGYASMAGFTLQDEPDGTSYPSEKYQDSTKDMEESQALAQMLSQYPNLTGFTNLFPYWNTLGTVDQYKEYLNEYFTKYGNGADHLCFDYYVFSEGIEVKDGRSKAEYFQNLAMIKAAADANEVPFWSSIQVGNYVSGDKQRNDLLSNLFGSGEKDYMTQGLTNWNVHTSLAYGAKGIAYYPIIQPYSYAAVNSGDPNYDRNGMIGADGQKTKFYDHIQNVNKQIAAVDEVLMNANHKGFVASGTALSESGVTNITGSALQSVTSNKSAGAFVGVFDYYGKDAYYVVNYDYSNEADITLNFDKDYALSITVDAAMTSANTTGSAYTLTLSAGNAALVLLGDANDGTAVANVTSLIAAIPEVPTEDKYYEAVVAARNAYNALTKSQKAQIPAAQLDTLNGHLEKVKSAETVAIAIDNLPDTFAIRHMDAIDNVIAAYNALGDWNVLVPEAQQTKFEGLRNARLGVNILINAANGTIDNPVDKIAYEVGREKDEEYGNVFTMKFSADMAAAGEAGFRLFGNLSGYTNRYFYIYNPTSKNVSIWMYNNWKAMNVNGASNNTLTVTPGWNKVEIPDAEQITNNFLGTFVDTAISGVTWKISSVYSVTSESQAQQEAAAVNTLIAELPDDVSVITDKNYTDYKTQIANIETQYNALSQLAKNYVDLTKVNDCKTQIATIEAQLGDQVKVDAVEALIEALPESAQVSVKDFADIDAAKKAFDNLGADLQAQVDSALSEKLTACTTVRSYYTVVYDAASSDATMDIATDTGTVSYTVNKGVDSNYGPVYKLNITQKGNGAYSGGFLVSKTGALTADSTVMVWICNPTQSNIPVEFYQNWTALTANDNNLEPGWNKVVLTNITTTDRIDGRIFADYNPEGEWLITSFYAVSQEAIDHEAAREEAAKLANVESLIKALPDANAIGDSNRAAITAAKEAFNALDEAQQAKVTNAQKLTDCLDKVDQWDDYDGKTVIDIADSSTGVVDAGVSTVIDNNTYGQVVSIPSGRDMVVVKPVAGNTAYKACAGIEFYVYNPTETALTWTTQDGGTGAAWLSFGNYTLEAKQWTKIQVVEQSDANGKMLISDGMELYFMGVMSGDGWLVTSVYSMTEADINAAKAAQVDKLIEALPDASTVILDNKAQIVAARTAYNALTDDQKALVQATNVTRLTACEEKLAELETPADNVTPVKNAITALPAATDLTVAHKEAVRTAESAYNALTDDEKAQVSNVAKLNNCIAKVNFWDELAAKTVVDASYQNLGCDGTLTVNVDDNTFGKVMTVGSGATYIAVTNNQKSVEFKASDAVGFYIYNPTDTDVDGYYTSDWINNGYFQLKANSWNYIELRNSGDDYTYTDDSGKEQNGYKQWVSNTATVYFYAAFTGEGWKVSSFYNQSAGATDVADATKVMDAASDYLVGSSATVATKTDDTDFGKVAAITEGAANSWFAVDCKQNNTAFTTSKDIVFYIYNPTGNNVNGYYTMDWQYSVYFQLKDGWNRIHLADFASADNKQFISETVGVTDNWDGTIYFYIDLSTNGWKISSFYSLPDPTLIGTAEETDPEAEAIAAVIAQITALPEATNIQLTDKDAVTAAQTAYNNLSDTGKKQVSNAQKLTDCVNKITELEADAAAAAAVNSQISALPEATELTVANKDAVRTAETAFNALSDSGKAQVTDADKLNKCIGKVNYWDELDAKTVKSATADWFLGGSSTLTTNVDDNTFGKVAQIASGTTWIAIDSKTDEFKACDTIGFYIYNPTDTDVSMYYSTAAAGWGAIDNYTLSSGWTYIEITDTGRETANQVINNTETVYFYASFAEEGWLVSSFYSTPLPERPIEEVVLATGTTGSWAPYNGSANEGATITAGTDATYGDVAVVELTDATNLAAQRLAIDPPLDTTGYERIEFYVYNPGAEIQLQVQEQGGDWAKRTTVTLAEDAWTKVSFNCADYAGKDILIYIYGSIGVQYKISPIVGYKYY